MNVKNMYWGVQLEVWQRDEWLEPGCQSKHHLKPLPLPKCPLTKLTDASLDLAPECQTIVKYNTPCIVYIQVD